LEAFLSYDARGCIEEQTIDKGILINGYLPRPGVALATLLAAFMFVSAAVLWARSLRRIRDLPERSWESSVGKVNVLLVIALSVALALQYAASAWADAIEHPEALADIVFWSLVPYCLSVAGAALAVTWLSRRMRDHWRQGRRW